MFKQRFWGVCTALLLAVTTAHADPINGATSGITDPGQTITFDEFDLEQDEVITDQFASLGVTFTPNVYYNPQPFAWPNFDPPSVGSFTFDTSQGGVTGSNQNPVSLVFAGPQEAASFAMVTAGGSATFTSLLNGEVVESFTAATGTSANNFYGFSYTGDGDSRAFDEIQILVDSTNDVQLIDNLSFSFGATVPESPALLFLMLDTNGGAITEDSMITFTTLSNTYSGVLQGGAFRLPDFDAEYEQQQVQNGVTEVGLLGGGDIPGGSNHIYSTNGLPVEQDVQDAIVLGLDSINAHSFEWEQFLFGLGIDPVVMNTPGATLEGIPGGALVDWFQSFYFGFRDPLLVRGEIEMAVFGGNFGTVEASQTSELEIFPHDTAFDSIGNVQIILSDNPRRFDELVPLIGLSSSGVINNQIFTPPSTDPIPEPASVVLMGLALMGGAVMMRRRRNR